MAVVVAGIAVLLVNTASGLTIGLNKDGISYIGNTQAAYWTGREDTRLQLLRTLADVMSDYENTPMETRRDQYDTLIAGVIANNPAFITIYTVWKPNAVDGMDAANIDRVGSGPTGQ
ncbi:MAG: hypothetical protein LBQ94_11895, partial [Treponema sp.]|nr:hypothetical protein [Treponema sp.]